MPLATTSDLPRPPRPGEGGSLRSWLARLLVLAMLAAAVLVARHYLIVPASQTRVGVQRFKLVNPAPPPKAEEQKRPEPERQKEEEEKPEPVDTHKAQISLDESPMTGPPGPPGPPGARPAGEMLGLDTEGEGAGDSFGLIARRGGREITTLGGGGGGGGGRALRDHLLFANYGRLVAQRLEGDLQADATITSREYVVVVLVWVDAQGRITRCELPRSSGYGEIDLELRDLLAKAPLLPDPPTDLPQPMRLRFTVKKVEAAPAG